MKSIAMQRFLTVVFILPFLMVLAVLPACREQSTGDVVLYDFEKDSDLDRLHWKCRVLYELSPQHATRGNQALRLQLYPSTYPGLSPRLSHQDWRGFEALCFDIFNPEDNALFITVRIDDQKDYPDYPDRYNRRFAIGPGMNAVRIPVADLVTSGTGRKLNTGSIERFLFFMVNLKEKHTLFVDHIRLCDKLS